jgi:hypothetical protein
MEIPKQHPDFFNSAPETVENDFFDKIDNLVFFLMKLHEKHGASSVNFDLITKMIESLVIVQDNLKNKISDINQLGTISDIEEILLKGKDLIDDTFLKSTFQDLKHFEVENQVVQKKKKNYEIKE